MPCPQLIHVLGIKIPIIISADRPDVWGEWDGAKGTILLNVDADEDKLRITFLHELLHCIDDLLGINLKHSAVYSLSQVLWAVLKENPELTDWLIDALKAHRKSLDSNKLLES